MFVVVIVASMVLHDAVVIETSIEGFLLLGSVIHDDKPTTLNKALIIKSLVKKIRI